MKARYAQFWSVEGYHKIVCVFHALKTSSLLNDNSCFFLLPTIFLRTVINKMSCDFIPWSISRTTVTPCIRNTLLFRSDSDFRLVSQMISASFDLPQLQSILTELTKTFAGVRLNRLHSQPSFLSLLERTQTDWLDQLKVFSESGIASTISPLRW